MTYFEELATELNVKIEKDENGLYTGMCKVLAQMVNEIILSDDEKIFSLDWESQKKIIKDKFYSVFAYMA